MLASLLLMLSSGQAETTIGFDEPAITVWVKIEEQRNSSIYIRPDTIRKISPTERSVWRKTIFVKPEDKVKERLVKNVIDCVAETITITAITTYDKSGKLISSGAIKPSEQEADPVTPESLSETIMNNVCAAGGNEDERAPSIIATRSNSLEGQTGSGDAHVKQRLPRSASSAPMTPPKVVIRTPLNLA